MDLNDKNSIEYRAALVAQNRLESLILKLKEALANKKIKAILINEAEVAVILLALNEFKFDDKEENET